MRAPVGPLGRCSATAYDLMERTAVAPTRPRGPTGALITTAWLLISAPLAAQSGLTQDEALRLAFPPPAAIERRTAFLSEEQLARAKALAGADVEVASRVVTYYLGLRDGTPLGVAYFDRHRVRTLNEVLMFVVSPEGRMARVDILSFGSLRSIGPLRAGWVSSWGAAWTTHCRSRGRS